MRFVLSLVLGLTLAFGASSACKGKTDSPPKTATPETTASAAAETATKEQPKEVKSDDAHAAHAAHKPGKTHEGADKHSGHFEHRFDDAKKWSKNFDNPKRKEWQKPAHLAEVLGLAPGMTIADIGAGTGYFNETFSKAVGAKGAVWALDIEADMVRFMTERAAKDKLGNVLARQVKTDDPELGEATVDRIVIVNTWHHIADRKNYSKKLVRALKAGGKIAVVDYTKEAPRGPPAKHRIPAEAVAAELASVGLKAEVAKEDLPYQYVVVASLAAQ